ncbi:MAG: ribbon-helix-helix protein, CopG family [Chloroflexota bacterium]|nr:ribbon-helix-helix protein, CopG family [Chloroflexota bacterium]
MTIDIPEDVALQLEELAKRNDADIGDLLRELLARYANDSENDEKQWATLADMARHAKELNMASPEPVDTAGRSREILNAEFADYLQSRIDS